MCGSKVGQFMEKFDPLSARLIKGTDPLGSKLLGFEDKKTETVVVEAPPAPEPEKPAEATSTTTPGADNPTSARRQRRGISLLGMRAGTGALAQSSRPQAMGA